MQPALLSLARTYADRIIALMDGRMEFDGHPTTSTTSASATFTGKMWFAWKFGKEGTMTTNSNNLSSLRAGRCAAW